jgi:uncharacterized protein YPO0396
MSRLTLRLPETLHQQLAQVAEREGVSLNQYIVYALTRQSVTTPIGGATVESETVGEASRHENRQRSSFAALKGQLGEAAPTDIEAILAERDVASCEPELTPETIERLRSKLQAAKH